jgi:hypothetical protein
MRLISVNNQKSKWSGKKRMKPITTTVKGSRFTDTRGKERVKKFVPGRINDLPDINTQVCIVEPSLIEAYRLLDNIFQKAIGANPAVKSFLQANLTKEQIGLLIRVHNDVVE